MNSIQISIIRENKVTRFSNESEAEKYFDEVYSDSVNIMLKEQTKIIKLIDECMNDYDDEYNNQKREEILEEISKRRSNYEKKLSKLSKARYSYKWNYKNYEIESNQKFPFLRVSGIHKRNDRCELIDEKFYLIFNRNENIGDEVSSYKLYGRTNEEIDKIITKEKKRIFKQYSMFKDVYNVK